jgi:hypothetical protein
MSRWRRVPLPALLAVLALLLLVADALCYRAALPVAIEVHGGAATLRVGSQTLALGPVATPTALQLAPHDPVIHEYQLDGTDSANNFSLDPIYLHGIASSPYYRFQAWMRDLDGTSRWRDLQVRADGRPLRSIPEPSNGMVVPLPAAGDLRIALQLQRPETPMTLNLVSSDGSMLRVTLNRNDRQIGVTRVSPMTAGIIPIASAYFPLDVAPFAAMVLDALLRTVLWAIVAVFVVIASEALLAYAGLRASGVAGASIRLGHRCATMYSAGAIRARLAFSRLPDTRAGRWLRLRWLRLTRSIHPVGLLALAASLAFVAWIARVQYNGQPHIYDASAYFWAARLYASGHLWAAIPPAHDRFPGPFMLDFAGKRFTQYPPGTSLILAPGIALGVPWLVEPLLGTLALLAIGLISARLYDRRVATLTVLLGTLSPFYSYLAASYLSHAVALFFLAWGFWALLRFAQGGAGWNLPLAAALFGMAQLTRDQVALAFMAIALVGTLTLSWRQLRWDWWRWLVPGLYALAVALVFAFLNLEYNVLLTGTVQISPRLLFFPGDHWGFGQGVGFYGQHTLAAGFANLDELLTSLAITLYGWPFYLTLALLCVPFLTRRAVSADWLMLTGAALLIAAYVGYFYHGIYLGPRYLFEALPFLLLLTARGILSLGAVGLDAGHAAAAWLRRTGNVDVKHAPAQVSVVTIVLVAAFLACNLVYYLPRQIALHRDFTGLPSGMHIDLAAAYHPPLHNAIVVTSDYVLYEYVFFPLNDPMLRGDVLYALAGNEAQYAELRRAYPGRTLYLLNRAPDGTISYTPLSG